MQLTVVREPFRKLDDDDQEGGEGEGVGDVAEGVEFSMSDIVGTLDESVGEGLGGG